MNNRLGCFSTTAIIAAIVTALLVFSVALAGSNQLFSPGELSAKTGQAIGGVTSHAQIEDCAACHPSLRPSDNMATRCLACHSDIAAQKDDPDSLHGKFFANGPANECRLCHDEHQGPSGLLTNVNINFPHEDMGFSLIAHASENNISCAECHEGNYKIFDQATCVGCHSKYEAAFTTAHVLSFGKDCIACHDGKETFGRNFDHAGTSFPLTDLHANLLCTQCHENARSIADLQSTPITCEGCHAKDDPHEGRFGTACGECHTPVGWSPAKFDHDLANFKLTGKHVAVECEKCHTDGKFKGTASTCSSCHLKDDAHESQLGTDCSLCHTPDGWEPSTFDHKNSIFPLVGAHKTVDCEKCHTDKKFKGISTTCVSCHLKDDDHKGQLGTDCALCHSPVAWKPSTFNHNNSKFPLTGAHAIVACQNCHADKKFKGTSTTCGSCHSGDDKHNGRFGQDCGLCHSTTAWKPATFNHNLSAFKLTGAHANLACERCHKNGKFTGTPKSCNSCHGDPAFHSGMFGANCASCHNTSNWSAKYTGPHPGFGEHGGINHEGASCRDCHTQTLHSATCTKCHDSNNPGDGGGGGGEDH